jgi:hypothetical protein|nr:MAG TPA: putative zinc-ribbon domain protein [Caudoviricetes sp.]
MGKYKKEIRHCTRCNKPFSAYPENDEKLCANCKKADYEKMLKLNGYTPKHRLVRSVGDSFMELSAIPNALSAAQKDNTVSIQKTCRDCGKPFEITKAERIFFESHNMALPKRCLACRKVRKEARKENN